MADLLITNATIIPVDPARRIIENGAIAIEGRHIVALGPNEEITRDHDAPRSIDAEGKVAIPGLIDAHAHAGHGLIKTMSMHDGDAWEALCGSVYTTGSTPEFWYAESRLAALERIRFGVTCGVSLLGGGDTIMRTDDPAYGDAHMEGVRSVGGRDVMAVGPTRAPHPLKYADGGNNPREVDFDRQLETSLDLLTRWHGTSEERLNIALLYPVLRDEHERNMAAADYADACAQAQRVARAAREAGVVFTQDGHQRGSIRRASALDLLGPNALLSHAIDLHEDEIELCAQTGTSIAHNPSAVASIMGRCPAIELMDRGVTVALGSDATAPDRSGDMFRHMQQAMHYHRRHFRDPGILPPGRALEMATIEGARALGMEDRIGSLEPGKLADVVLVDMRRPHLSPPNMAVHRLVCFANGNDVDTVIVGGEVVLENGRPCRVSEDDILDDAAREADLMIDRTDSRAALQVPPGFWSAQRYGGRA
ncbi:amidohydrolase family protein [Lutimaribacter marinistellae]|uniref:Amidohydrolase family protein n=1 Tax=Lutimaribacter marinistellae TaxID=1820329 RepID=A0ABV7TF10_9RHOB